MRCVTGNDIGIWKMRKSRRRKHDCQLAIAKMPIALAKLQFPISVSIEDLGIETNRQLAIVNSKIVNWQSAIATLKTSLKIRGRYSILDSRPKRAAIKKV